MERTILARKLSVFCPYCPFLSSQHASCIAPMTKTDILCRKRTLSEARWFVPLSKRLIQAKQISTGLSKIRLTSQKQAVRDRLEQASGTSVRESQSLRIEFLKIDSRVPFSASHIEDRFLLLSLQSSCTIDESLESFSQNQIRLRNPKRVSFKVGG